LSNLNIKITHKYPCVLPKEKPSSILPHPFSISYTCQFDK
jgi:hypothetical protein